MRSVDVIGVYPVEPDELYPDVPCHLIELAIGESGRAFNMDDVVQIDERIGKDFWQSAYDERFLDAQSLEPLPEAYEQPDRSVYRVVFFFHFLDLTKPLQSSFGPLALPQPSPRPEHLTFMEWMPPF
jgi:hypothetical protein